MNSLCGISKEHRNQMVTGFDSENGSSLQIRWNWSIRNGLNKFILKSLEFSQSKLRILEGGD
jgi:hypothetical protein